MSDLTGSKIKQMFIDIVDDEDLTDTFIYQLMNKAKDGVERLRAWLMLRVKNDDNTTTVGNTYTDSVTLPDNFRSMRKIMIGDSEWRPIPFERQIEFKDSSGFYFIDVANNKLYLCGVIQKTETITMFYIKTTNDIESDTLPVWPSDFHKLIPFEMAYIFNGSVDADSISFRMSNSQIAQRNNILEGMELWDDDLALAGMDNSTSPPAEVRGENQISQSDLN